LYLTELLSKLIEMNTYTKSDKKRVFGTDLQFSWTNRRAVGKLLDPNHTFVSCTIDVMKCFIKLLIIYTGTAIYKWYD